jgi:hypothetical protein
MSKVSTTEFQVWEKLPFGSHARSPAQASPKQPINLSITGTV